MLSKSISLESADIVTILNFLINEHVSHFIYFGFNSFQKFLIILSIMT